MLDRSIPSLWAHRPFEATHIKPGLLKPERDEVEEADELTEHNALRCSILQSKVAQLLDKGLDLGRRPPRVEVEPAQDTLSSGYYTLLNFHCRRLEIDGKWKMAYWAIGFLQVAVSQYAKKDVVNATYSSLQRSLQILLDALAIENVVTLRLDCIFCEFVTQSADGGFSRFIGHESCGITLTANDQVGMARHLPHAGEKTEDVGIV